MVAFMVTILFMFLVFKSKVPWHYVFIIFYCCFFDIIFYVNMKRADIAITKRAKEIDRDVLFAGRFLLVKLNSGKPLMNSII